MSRRSTLGLIILIAGIGGLLLLSMTHPLSARQLPDHHADVANGERMFWAAGCASCHAAPGAENDARLRLAGGAELKTQFGTFRSPNISPDHEHGIGSWTLLEFVNAMVKGISPEGHHYYPAFPYTYYRRMLTEDVIDLKAFLDTLPPNHNQVADHTLKFPYAIRRGIGLWKLLYLDNESDRSGLEQTTPIQIGGYLVNGPGHCGACHTPHGIFGGQTSARLLAGARSMEIPRESDDGKAEWIPNITPHKDGLGDWSELDIAYALESGFDPDFDTFGGSMVEVQENMAKLSPEDRRAIAAYLKSIPPLPTQKPYPGD